MHFKKIKNIRKMLQRIIIFCNFFRNSKFPLKLQIRKKKFSYTVYIYLFFHVLKRMHRTAKNQTFAIFLQKFVPIKKSKTLNNSANEPRKLNFF